MQQLTPILVADLFPEINDHLITLLRSLTVEEWHLPTCSSRRNVKDIASHLLYGSLLWLSGDRDEYKPPDGSSSMRPDESLVDFVSRLNSDWEIGTRRISPRVLVGLIEWAIPQYVAVVQSLDPFGLATYPVAWAGEEQSYNWMDVARNYTERWHHTQQIFDATKRPSTITTRGLFYPCLDTFMRALPFTYRNVVAETGTTLTVTVTGEAGGSWYIERSADGWRQIARCATKPAAVVMLDQDSAWRLVTKRRSREETHALFPDIRITGNTDIAAHVLEMVSVIS